MKELTKEQMMHAIKNGEFEEELINGDKVAIVLTQGWCPQWHAMKPYLDDINAEIYVLVYDEVDYFDQVREFKESKWKNDQVPYVRYYSKGKLVNQSNFVQKEEFNALISS